MRGRKENRGLLCVGVIAVKRGFIIIIIFLPLSRKVRGKRGRRLDFGSIPSPFLSSSFHLSLSHLLPRSLDRWVPNKIRQIYYSQLKEKTKHCNYSILTCKCLQEIFLLFLSISVLFFSHFWHHPWRRQGGGGGLKASRNWDVSASLSPLLPSSLLTAPPLTLHLHTQKRKERGEWSE